VLKFLRKLFLYIVALWVIGFFVFIGLSKYIENEDSYIECSVVLTGGSNRIQEAINLIDQNMTTIVFVSGVNEKVDKRDILGEGFNKYKKYFILGYEAVNTKGNVIEVSKWIEDNEISEMRIITSDYHYFRTQAEFNSYMPDIDKDIYLVKSINGQFLSSFYNWKVLFGEYNKLIYVVLSNGVNNASN
jgi:uncharacterized SAM-binding protein YcdF (DUF218 family)